MPDNRVGCKLCLAIDDVKIEDVDKILMTPEAFEMHLENIHKIPVRRMRETRKQARIRFLLEHPEMTDIKWCHCTVCQSKKEHKEAV
jgi:hypothetical protein